ncbi:protein sickie isoform X6 [Drosophila guanche]|uniref:protein sickie isoform X6 n=1 Tax=Drosophila guanche TaxID=7266 RepID=UPI001471F472|nr:protein sickie isoform X6 [Drosophila guanche]
MLARCVSYQGSCDNINGILTRDYAKIYTDWANYYLERAKSKRKVTDLSADCRDGLLLAEVIEAVTSFKVPDLVKKPKSQQQMYDNVNSCLHVLRGQSVGGLDNITTNDICAGRLKAVLALFFALSRFKQQAKQTKSIGVGCGGSSNNSGAGSGTSNTALSGGSVLGIGLGGSLRAPGSAGTLLHDKNQQEQQKQQLQQQQQQQTPQQLAQSLENGNEMVNRQIAPAYKVNGGTAIPLPATVMVQRRCPPDKVRPLPPTPNHTPSIPGLGKSGSDFNTSRPNSPPTSNHTIQSLKSGNNNSLRPPSVKSNHQSGIPSPSSPQTTSHTTTTTTAAAAAAPQKHSMLDKLKLFNKEKQQNAVNAASAAANKSQIQQQQSKRTSSSSGFSSARSERSDSSLSLNDGHNSSQLKPPSISVTSQKPQQKHNTKQSKLLAAQQKKEQTKSKLDKKEKSPARSLHKEESGNESRSSTMGRAGKSSLARGGLGLGLAVEKNTLKTASKSSLHSKSESKSSLKGAGVQQQQLLHSPSGTGLPKPIAAIKGTSKLPAPLGGEQLKRETSDISAANQATQTTQNISMAGQEQPQSSTSTPHILKAAAPPPYYANSSSSPPTHISQGHPGMGGYLSEPSTPQQGIYGSSTGSRLPPPKTALGAPRKLEYNAGPHILSSPPHRGAGLQRPMPNSAPNTPTASPHKFHTIPSKIVGTIYESKEEQQPQQSGGCSAGASVLPMRPLLRGYNSHVTLPTRGARGGHHHPHQSYLDFCESDLGQGYCSDGDALRIGSSPATSRYHDIDNGYLSEGSSGLNGHSTIGGSTGGGAVSHGKHFLSMMRARTQLPTTIEERIRNSRGSLDSIGTAANGSSAASQASSSGGSTTHSSNSNSNSTTANHNNNHINNNNSGGKMDGSPHHRPGSRNGRDNWSKMPEPLNGQKGDKSSEKSSPSRRSMGGGSGGSSKQGSPSSSSRTKGVPPSFGYVKRANGSMSSTAEQQNIVMMMAAGGGQAQQVNGLPCGRTAHVSAVPRTANGRKIAPGTQTLPNDMNKLTPNTQCRSFSLTGPTAAQLSQSIRERLATGSHSLPKPGSDMHVFQHRMSNRPGTRHDGSLSDTQTYAEVKPEYSSYAMWLKHSNTAGSRLSDGDAIEQLQIGSPAMTRHGHKMIHNRSAGGLPPGGQMQPMQGNESPYVQSPRMNRSNSISYLQERTYPRSTKSEKMYPSMLSRGGDVEIEPYYCLPVGTNGVLSAQMAAAVAAQAQAQAQVQAQAQAQATQANSGNNVVGGSVAWSQPTSPTPLNRGPFAASVAAAAAAAAAGVLSPTHGATAGATGMVGGMGMGPGAGSGLTGGHRLTYPKKNDDVHGSAASLLSGGSSLYGSAEERQAHEIRRLKRELQDARDQVLSLSSQLSTNAHVVTAFEQSLTNMTNRLQQLTATSERKDGELTDMRQTIELLRKQSIQAGLTTAHMQSMGQNQHQMQSQSQAGDQKPPPGPGGSRSTSNGNGNGMPLGLGMVRQHSTDSMCSLNSISSGCSAAQDKNKANKKKGWLRSSFTKAFSRNAKISKTSRHVGHQHQHHHHNQQEHGSGKATLPNGHGGEPLGLAALATQPAPPLPNSKQSSPAKTLTLIDNAKPIDAIDGEDQQVVEDLKKQLREKDLVLTDIRLEALSSASQLESLKDMMNKMRAEMMSLKQNNERLQKLVTTRSLAGSEVSLGQAISPNGSVAGSSEVSRRYSLADGSARPPMELPARLSEELEEDCMPPAPAPEPPPPPAPNTAAVAPLSPSTHIDLTPPPPALEAAPLTSPVHMPSAVEDLPDVCDGKKIAIACYLGQPESFAKYCEELQELDGFYANGSIIASHEAAAQSQGERKVSFAAASSNEFIVACTYISGKTTWQNLDYIVRKTFKDYVARIDPGTNLGLNTDSITSYHLGEAKRGPEMGFPELLPCGYIVGSVRTLYICLQGVGSLAFDSLIPRSIVHRYISLLTEHRRLILCGPSGTGKSYLARRLAEFLVARAGRGNPSEAIATFNVDHKSSKDLRQYLGHIAEQAAIANGASELPSVIILDNLHHASALGDVFSCLLSAGPANKLPCIIGTMSQATCNTTNLQLHHNFRWVLTANHMEPVKGFLGRFLRRRLFQLELQTQHPQPELASVLAWLPSVWQHINRFLEVHSSSDVTIGPRLFLSCPLDLKDSQVWFTDIWNYHLSPYLVEAVREGVQLYGRRGGAWNDPSAFIRNSYPWPYGPDSVPPLRQINAEDVGLEGVALTNGENQDPLLNMLMRLQEAANYSEAQDQESDCASLDSNVTPDSSAGAE